jgi:hypothetical protein
MRSTAELVCVDPKQVHEIWPHVRHLLTAACSPIGPNAFADIEADILWDRNLLLQAWNGRAIGAAAGTIRINSDVGRVCIITVCGGRGFMRRLPLLGEIEAYAKGEDCACVRFFGCRAWLRVLDGYTRKHIIRDKDWVDGCSK